MAVDAKNKAWAKVHLTPYEQALQQADQTKQAKQYQRERHAGFLESYNDPPPPPPDGLKVTLSSIGGLTQDKQGRALLPKPFVFQCGPLEQYTVAHEFNMGTYDTIDDDQFARRGSRQLDTWQFDTLAMYLGATKDGKHYLPGWVPYPTPMPGGQQYRRPEWYVEQLRSLFDAGAPFRYACAFKHSTTIHRTFALLTAFNEDYRHGEGDAIYLSAVSFMQWRDPRGSSTQHQSRAAAASPRHFKVNNEVNNGPFLAWDDRSDRSGRPTRTSRPPSATSRASTTTTLGSGVPSRRRTSSTAAAVTPRSTRLGSQRLQEADRLVPDRAQEADRETRRAEGHQAEVAPMTATKPKDRHKEVQRHKKLTAETVTLTPAEEARVVASRSVRRALTTVTCEPPTSGRRGCERSCAGRGTPSTSPGCATASPGMTSPPTTCGTSTRRRR